MSSGTTLGAQLKTGWVTALTDYDENDLEGAGSLRVEQDGDIFRWVKNASSDAAKVGAPACFDAGNATASDLFTECVVEDQDTGDEMLFAGIWQSAVPGGDYGWIQVTGQYTEARVSVGSGVNIVYGDVLVPNLLTNTAATDYVSYSLVKLAARTDADTALKFAKLNDPHCLAIEAIGTPLTTTAAIPLAVIVRGLL